MCIRDRVVLGALSTVVSLKGTAGARVLGLFNRQNSHQASLRTTVLWMCILYEIPMLSAPICRLIQAEHKNRWTDSCADAGLILTGHQWWHLYIALVLIHMLLATLWTVFASPEPGPFGAKVSPVVVGEPRVFRQELAAVRAYGMSDIQDLVSGESARDGLPHIFKAIMFDLLLVPTVWVASAGLVCRDGDLAVYSDVRCWEGPHVAIVVGSILLLLWMGIGNLVCYLPKKNSISLCLRHHESVDMLHFLNKVGLVVLAAEHGHFLDDTQPFTLCAMCMLVVTTIASFFQPPCTGSHGQAATALKLGTLSAALLVSALAVATAYAENGSDVPGWPLICIPIVPTIVYATLTRASCWERKVRRAGQLEMSKVFASLREGFSDSELTQLDSFLLSLRPLGGQGIEALAAELGQGEWSLPSLSLDLHGIKQEACVKLAAALKSGHCQLSALNLQANRIGDAGAVAVAEALGMQSLVELNLSFNSIGHVGIQKLSSALRSKECTLQQLKLNGNVMDERSAALLGAAVGVNKTLTDLSLAECGMCARVTSELLMGMVPNRKLSQLWLSGNRFGTSPEVDQVVEQLGTLLDEHQQLTSLRLANCGIDRSFTVGLADKIASSGLSMLDLQSNPLGDSGCNDVCNAVKQSVSLTSLSLSNCSLGRLSGVYLAKMLLETKAPLATLDLSNNGICSHGMFYDGLIALCDAVLSSDHLRHLNLERIQLRNMGCWSVAKMLQSDQCGLRTLNLASNEIRSRGAAAVFKAIDGNSALVSLSLRSNMICSDAVSNLQAVILYNKTIKTIDLENNDLCERGGKQIAAAITSSTTLSSVSLIMNEFRIKEAEKWFSPETRHLVLLRRKDRMQFDRLQRIPAPEGVKRQSYDDVRNKNDVLSKSKCAGCSCWLFTVSTRIA
eukprot:TRINITY_DN2442_c0_g1_i1.p1 TRINITY_DN2442_c0_g1~~TRINITY_DN2442_c0_g1_i1.p1  ORF type:complete len:904 (+),score=196.25 TRINITY_DN2442_c0_g1_i1:190-2901(+)